MGIGVGVLLGWICEGVFGLWVEWGGGGRKVFVFILFVGVFVDLGDGFFFVVFGL